MHVNVQLPNNNCSITITLELLTMRVLSKRGAGAVDSRQTSSAAPWNTTLACSNYTTNMDLDACLWGHYSLVQTSPTSIHGAKNSLAISCCAVTIATHVWRHKHVGTFSEPHPPPLPSPGALGKLFSSPAPNTLPYVTLVALHLDSVSVPKSLEKKSLIAI